MYFVAMNIIIDISHKTGGHNICGKTRYKIKDTAGPLYYVYDMPRPHGSWLMVYVYVQRDSSVLVEFWAMGPVVPAHADRLFPKIIPITTSTAEV